MKIGYQSVISHCDEGEFLISLHSPGVVESKRVHVIRSGHMDSMLRDSSDAPLMLHFTVEKKKS